MIFPFCAWMSQLSKVAGAILSVLLVSPPYSVVVVGNGLSTVRPSSSAS